MRKLFLKFSALLFVLIFGTNAVVANGDMVASLPDEVKIALAQKTYCAQLTGHASSTGGGKVYVTDNATDPRNGGYTEGTSNVAVNGMGMSMSGMDAAKVGLWAWAKAEPGYTFTGWSYSNMGTDLGTTTDDAIPGMYANAYETAIAANETVNHVIYGTFEPIRLAGYEITGNTTTAPDGGNMVCNLAVIFTPSGAEEDIDASDFKAPAVSGDGWSLVNWDYNTSNAGKVTANVRFTTTSTDVAEYAGSLKLETQATPAISMNVPLNARTAASSDIEAIRYNKNKVKQGEGSLTAMIAAAAPTDVIKLNKNYEGQVVATKSFTLDLNGYNIEYPYNTPRASEFDEAAIAQAALLVNAGATVTIAYSPYGGEIIAGPFNDAADVFGKLVLNGGTLSGFFGVGSVGVVEQNGATINGSVYSSCAIASQGKVTITDGKMNAMVGSMGDGSELIINGGIIDNTVIANPMSGTPGHGVQIGGSICRINKGTITGRTYGVQNTTIGGGEITIEKLAVIKGGDLYYALDCGGGTTTVNCGKFEDPAKLWDPTTIESRINEGKAEFVSCYFQTNNQGEDEYWGEHVWRNTSGAEFREGYEFFAGSAEDAKTAGVSVCHIGGNSYSTLEDALAFVNNSSDPATIIMDNDYTLPAGHYTLPANATLIVPRCNEQGSESQIVNREYSLETPTLFRKLTFLDGVNMDVFGKIEISGSQYSGHSNQSEGSHTGAVTSDYAQLQMNKGSRITLQSGSVLRAWGFVTGDIANKNAQFDVPMGEIDARRGATVYELFQMGDWGETVMNAMGLVTGDTHFPINSYFIQNIEVPVKYHPGARLTTATTVSAANGGLALTMCANNIQIIGVNKVDIAMFLMDQEADAENTWVRKWYDASKDQQVYEINSGAHIGNLVINLASSPLFEGLENTLAGMDGIFGTIGNLAQKNGAEFHQDLIMNSGQYVLPITSNFKLHLLSGLLDFTQSTEMIPGSELEIDKEATVYVTDQNLENVQEGSLYIYDWQDWITPAQKVAYSPVFDGEPTTRDVSSVEALGHAIVNVHGTFDTKDGFVFTSENGGNIFSSVEDAGTFTFTSEAKLEGYFENVKVSSSQTKIFYPAYLRNSAEWVANGGDEYVQTGGTAEGKSYCYLDFDGRGGRWTMLEQSDCFTYDDATDTYYIKPQEYVAVTSNVEDPVTHTYSDAAGKGRLFISIMDEEGHCQWWEVEEKDNYFHCIHPENDTYYEWDEENEEWKEKTFTITWLNWDNTPIKSYDYTKPSKPEIPYVVTYGTMAEYLGEIPTRPADVDYTYDFKGWSPELGKVTSNVTYTATYDKKQIKYTVKFVQDGGSPIEEHLYARDEVPVCENLPTRTGYILQWEPAIEPVVGNQTYVATWLPEPPAQYTITFKNYDGSPLEQKLVDAETMPAYAGATPTKTATSEYTYSFVGWKPALAPATTNATYVAQFSETAKTYSVKFYDENGSALLKEQTLAWGDAPTPPAVSKTETGYTYTYVWQNMADASKTIESVKGAANYKPVFTGTPNKYTVTLRSNLPNSCTFSGAGIYDYQTNVTVSVTPKDGFEFLKWQERGGEANLGSIEVTGDITLTAVVKETEKQEPSNLELGLDAAQTVESATDYMDVIITSDGIEHSSQIINANNITLYGNADFVLKKNMEARHWYDIAVPWRVNANGGIFLGNSTKPAVLGTDIEIFYYDGAVRAKEGPVDACWVALKNQSKKILEPGRAYLFLLYRTSAESVTFRKKVQEPLLTTETSVQQFNSLTGDDKDGGWNGIANPALYKAFLNAGASFAQKINDAGDGYETIDEEQKLVVGQPVYVQVDAPKSPVVANSGSYAAPARRAVAKASLTRYEVTIASAKIADRVFVQLNEDKEQNKYTIGLDLAKFGTGSTVAQMWINRYNSKLSVNTMVPEGEATNFPMSIYVPKAGEYTIAIEHEVASEDYALYLTYKGEAVWNLSEGAYVADLQKGTDANYGLRISAKAPQTATDINEAVVDAQGDTRKVLLNNQVFIIRDNKVYTVDGRMVK